MKQKSSIPNNESVTTCSACGGDCCRTRPGIESPERFVAAANPAGELARLLASGLWVLDTHYGVPYDPAKGEKGDPDRIIHYPRPATRQEHAAGSVQVVPGAGECVLLGDGGCTLPFTERPRACQALEPVADFACTSSWTRFDAAREWQQHQDIINEALGLLSSTSDPTSLIK